MKLRVKKDIIIPAGTLLSAHPRPTTRHYYRNSFFHTMGFGADIHADFAIFYDNGTPEFLEHFEPVEEDAP